MEGRKGREEADGEVEMMRARVAVRRKNYGRLLRKGREGGGWQREEGGGKETRRHGNITEPTVPASKKPVQIGGLGLMGCSGGEENRAKL